MSKSKVQYIDGSKLETKEVKIKISDPHSLTILKNLPEDNQEEFLSRALILG